MPKKQRIKELQDLPVHMVGDGKSPNVFFVSEQGTILTVTRDFEIAYKHWRQLADQRPRVECDLEDRRFGTIANVQPEWEGSKRLLIFDDRDLFLKHYPQK